MSEKKGNLIIELKKGEWIECLFEGRSCAIHLHEVGIRGKHAKLRIEAPKDIKINRSNWVKK